MKQQFPTEQFQQPQVEKQLSPIEQFELIPKNTLDQGTYNYLQEESPTPSCDNSTAWFTNSPTSSFPVPPTTAPTNSETGISGVHFSCVSSSLYSSTVKLFILSIPRRYSIRPTLFFCFHRCYDRYFQHPCTWRTNLLSTISIYIRLLLVPIIYSCIGDSSYEICAVFQSMGQVNIYSCVNIMVYFMQFIWNINLAARAFVAVNVAEDRKFVALYPICIFYIFLGVLLMFM